LDRVQPPPGIQLAFLERIMRSQTSEPFEPDTRSGTVVPTVAVLDTWANFNWTDGCQVDELEAFQPLTIVTRNHVYEMVVLEGASGLVRIRGGQFFPEWRQVHLAGCSLGGSFLKLRGIYAGFGMEVHVAGEVVVTSAVQRLTLSHCEPSSTH
jgi:hypothetical protein